MPLAETLSLILRHPLNRGRPARALLRFAHWQISSRWTKGPRVMPWVNGTLLNVRRGETGLTGNVYCGLHEFPEMAFVLHALTPRDLFVDIGANAGAYAVLASGARGASTLAFEPVPETFGRLEANLRLNRLEGLAEARNLGLADHPGVLRFTNSLDCINHVMREGEPGPGLEVPVTTLDRALGGRAPAVLKMDVEGFETPVLNGARQALAAPSLFAVIIELNRSGARYGFSDEEIVALLRTAGFAPARYEPFARRLIPLEGRDPCSGNTIFVRNPERVMQRLAASLTFRVLGQSL